MANFNINTVFYRYGDKGIAGNWGDESPKTYSHMAASRKLHTFKFSTKDKVAVIDASYNPEGAGEYLYEALKTKEDDKFLSIYRQADEDDLLAMDTIGAYRAKKQGYDGVVFYCGKSETLKAIDLRNHKLREIKGNIKRIFNEAIRTAIEYEINPGSKKPRPNYTFNYDQDTFILYLNIAKKKYAYYNISPFKFAKFRTMLRKNFGKAMAYLKKTQG